MADTPQPNPFGDVHPYRPARLPDAGARRPGGLTAICVIAVILGVLGLFSGALKGINVLFGAQMQQAFGTIGAANQQQARVQQEMQAAIAAEIQRFAVVNGMLCVCQIVLCGLLLYAGLKALGLKAVGRKLLIAACLCLLLYESGQLAVFILQQLSMSPIMELYLPRMMQDPSGNNAGAAKFGQVIARMSIVIGIVMQCVWTLIKFVFFVVAVRYLHHAKVMALFDSPLPPPPLQPETP